MMGDRHVGMVREYAIELAGGRLDGYREIVRRLDPSRWYPSAPVRPAAFVAGHVPADLPPIPRTVEYRRTERVRPDGSVVYELAGTA